MRLQCQNSIEEKIWQASEDKRLIADKSIAGGLFDRKTDEPARSDLVDIVNHCPTRYGTNCGGKHLFVDYKYLSARVSTDGLYVL